MIAIMQPTYMPWLGYFSMIDEVDQFVFLDQVQLVKRSWQVRNKIKLNGKEKLLTIPVRHMEEREKCRINTAEYAGDEWKSSHLETIRQAYRHARHFKEIYDFLKENYGKDYSSIGDFHIQMITDISKKIGIQTPFFRASETGGQGKKDALLADICKRMNADAYLAARGSAAYIEENGPGGEFSRQGIKLFYQEYNHPEYEQQGEEFLSHIGIYDLLFHVGFENALGIIRKGQKFSER